MKREENQTVEYKQSWHDKYLEWICGYANAKGGTLYIGIDNATKEPVGLRDPDKLMEDIPNSIRNTMGVVADVSLFKKRGKPVIRIKVPPSSFPVSYNGRFHYRTGAVKMLLTGPALTQFLMEKSGRQWDCVPCFGGHRASDFTFIALKNLYEKASGAKLSKQDMVSFGLVAGAGVLTNTGALLADESPISHSRVFCTRWNGLDMTAGVMDAADDQEYAGGLLQLLKYAEDFVRLHTRRAWHKRPTDRVNFREYPERSVREMLVNALVHRDYLETGSEVHVDVFDDRIEITSPGGMPGDRKVQEYANIRRIPSRRRNKCLADMFERLDLMERKGSGFKKLCEDYEKLSVNLGGRMPILESETDYFRVTLPNLLHGFTDEQLVAAVDDSEYGKPKDVVPAIPTPPVTPPVAPPVAPPVDEKAGRLLRALENTVLGTSELMKALHLRDRNHLREGYVRPALRAGLIEQTKPEVKHSKLQKYRLTAKGRAALA